ncbi:MAG: hypothetical protein ACR2QF_14110 [Geminicoccaceae bacterium]
MAFSWVLGRRHKSLDDDVEDQTWPPSQEKAGRKQRRQDDAIDLADVELSIERGLVMAFGPLGDPIPPQLLKEACVRQPQATLQLPDGLTVDHKRLITVIEAQQAGQLAEHPNDEWVKAMLGAEECFEPTSSELLASEDLEGKSVPVGNLVLDMPSGETIRLFDAHPGGEGVDRPARLMVDGKPVSITGLGALAGRSDRRDRSQPVSNPVISVRGEDLAILLEDQIEARLETTSTVWDGEAKVALFLEDGRPISIDDLTMLLGDIPPCRPPEVQVSAKTYPLMGDHGPDFDLEEATIVTVSDMPEGWSLSAGRRDKRGSWILDPSSLMNASVRVSRLDPGPHSLHVKVISSIGREGTLDQQTCTIVMPPNASADQVEPLPPSPQEDPGRLFSIALVLDEEEASRAGHADAILLRGIPKDVSLSSGVFDPSLNGWVFKPEHLDGLTIQDLDLRFDVIDIELRAFYLDREGQARSELIVSKVIAKEDWANLESAGEGISRAQSR